MSAAARLVIGVGNASRGDDAAGLEVVRRLAGRVPDGVALIEHDGEATRLFEWLAGAEAVVLIDAAAPRGAPGTLHRFDATASALPTERLGTSSHGFGVPEGIELARALGKLPARCVVIAIEGRDFDPGAALSPPVEAALDAAAAAVRSALGDTTNPLVAGTSGVASSTATVGGSSPPRINVEERQGGSSERCTKQG